MDIVTDEWSGDRILEIEVRGKRGVGYCKSMPGAVLLFERLSARLRRVGDVERLPKPMDKLFPNEFKKMFNDNHLKFDRDGKPRTAYSLRHSYICFRLLEGADIYQIAKNCRTLVEMIEKHYAAHLKDVIDTSLINVRKSRHVPKSIGGVKKINNSPKHERQLEVLFRSCQLFYSCFIEARGLFGQKLFVSIKG